MATRRIREFLDGNAVRYAVISHSPAHSAQEVAESTHIPGRYMAKTVIVWVDGRMAMAVVPATKDVGLELLRQQTGAMEVRLAEEPEFMNRFSGCQLGTVPPFGNLFGMTTFMDREMLLHKSIAFPAGTHRDAIIMAIADYNRLVRPELVGIALAPIGTAGHVLSL